MVIEAVQRRQGVKITNLHLARRNRSLPEPATFLSWAVQQQVHRKQAGCHASYERFASGVRPRPLALCRLSWSSAARLLVKHDLAGVT